MTENKSNGILKENQLGRQTLSERYVKQKDKPSSKQNNDTRCNARARTKTKTKTTDLS